MNDGRLDGRVTFVVLDDRRHSRVAMSLVRFGRLDRRGPGLRVTEDRYPSLGAPNIVGAVSERVSGDDDYSRQTSVPTGTSASVTSWSRIIAIGGSEPRMWATTEVAVTGLSAPPGERSVRENGDGGSRSEPTVGKSSTAFPRTANAPVTTSSRSAMAHRISTPTERARHAGASVRDVSWTHTRRHGRAPACNPVRDGFISTGSRRAPSRRRGSRSPTTSVDGASVWSGSTFGDRLWSTSGCRP